VLLTGAQLIVEMIELVLEMLFLSVELVQMELAELFLLLSQLVEHTLFHLLHFLCEQMIFFIELIILGLDFHTRHAFFLCL
jgi:hypothetical protein